MYQGKNSFSQCGEDLIVDFLFTCNGISHGSYLDIGAHHPTYYNNTFYFYRNGWTGVNIDPLRDNIELFNKQRRKDINLCAGIGDVTECRTFYRMMPRTLSTFDELTARRYSALGHRIDREEKIEFISVIDFIGRVELGGKIDLLSIDIEGDEYSIIRDFVANGVSASVIICETVDYSPSLSEGAKKMDVIEKICELGYKVYADTFINTIFVSKQFWP